MFCVFSPSFPPFLTHSINVILLLYLFFLSSSSFPKPLTFSHSLFSLDVSSCVCHAMCERAVNDLSDARGNEEVAENEERTAVCEREKDAHRII